MIRIRKRNYSFSDVFIDLFIYVFMIVLCITTVYPFVYLLSLSLSSPNVSLTTIYLIPPEISLANYIKVLRSEYILSGFRMTIFRTVLGTAITMVAIICTAYPLSKKFFPNRTFWTGFIVFTMFFGGGLVPSYLLVRSLGFIDTIWALTIPGMIPTFSMIIVRNFFMTIPDSLEESAKIDGANDITILARIIVPLSLPVIATVVLWTSVGHWNAWFDSMIYMRDLKKHVLQVVLRRIVLEGTQQMMEMNNAAAISEEMLINPDNVKAATIMVATLPVIMLYPFVQKYFIHGVMVGSLKG